MSLKRLPASGLEPLVRRYLSAEEDEATVKLIGRLQRAKTRGYLTATELEAVCYWKSPRAIHHIRKNSAARIRAVTRSALATGSERRRFESLLELDGVSVPMASALLTLLDPKRYGVLDIRVWQLLHATGAVTKNARGVGFTPANWHEFLTILRRYSLKFRVKARDVERTLFWIHREYQAGNLYRRNS